MNPFSSTTFCPSSLNMNSINFVPSSDILSSLLTNKKGLAIGYLLSFTFSTVNSTPSIVNAFTLSSTYPKEMYPIEFSFPSTIDFIFPEPSLIWASLVNSSDSKPTFSWNPSRVPEPSSLDTTTIGASLPPTSFQLVIFPVYMSFTCSSVKSFTPLF